MARCMNPPLLPSKERHAYLSLLLLAGLGLGCGPSNQVGPGLGDGATASSDAGFQPGDPHVRGDAPSPQSASERGPYAVEQLKPDDGLRDGPDYGSATVYYPVGAEPPFASIVVVPGYVSPESTIQEWGPFFASHGILTMTIGTNSTEDDPEQRRDALLDALVTLRAENQRENSPLLGQVDVDRMAVSGWSMGGGGAQLAAELSPDLKAVIALCPWQPDADFDHPVPVLIFAGASDFIARTRTHARQHYDSTPSSTQKLLFEVRGGGHRVANTPSGGDDDVGLFALSWLKVFLEGDERYRSFLLEEPGSASQFETNLEE